MKKMTYSQFGQLILEKHGWKKGMGLGREESGITEAIKPKLKFDTSGLGHDIAEEYKFQWWDHVFNKAARNISVEKVQGGSVQLQRKEDLRVSTKKSSSKEKDKFYGTFVKGGTLLGSSIEEASGSDDSEEERDLSTKLTDEELFKICGGRTAHKGARHGLTMSAKLARVAKQEEELMQKWNTKAKQQSENVTDTKKRKNLKEKRNNDEVSIHTKPEQEYDATGEVPKKKKKKHLKQRNEQGSPCDYVTEELETIVKDHKKKALIVEENEVVVSLEDFSDTKKEAKKEKRLKKSTICRVK